MRTCLKSWRAILELTATLLQRFWLPGPSHIVLHTKSIYTNSNSFQTWPCLHQPCAVLLHVLLSLLRSLPSSGSCSSFASSFWSSWISSCLSSFCSSCSFCLSFLHPWQQVPRSFHSSLSPSWTSWPSHAWSSQHTQRVAGKPALAATEENNTQHEPPEQWMMKSSRNHCRSLTHRSTHPRMQHAFV